MLLTRGGSEAPAGCHAAVIGKGVDGGGTSSGVSAGHSAPFPRTTAEFLTRAWTCFLGHVPTNASGVPFLPPINTTRDVSDVCNITSFESTYEPGDEVCAASGGSAAVWFLVYILFNVTFNVLLLWLTKRMSATWAQIGTVLCLDLASIFSQFRFLMGSEAQMLTLQQVCR